MKVDYVLPKVFWQDAAKQEPIDVMWWYKQDDPSRRTDVFEGPCGLGPYLCPKRRSAVLNKL